MGGLGHGIPRGRVVGLRGNNKQDLHQRGAAAHQITVPVHPPHGIRHNNARHGTRVKALAANTTGEKNILKNPKNQASKEYFY